MIDLSQMKRVVLPDEFPDDSKFIQLYINGEPFFRAKSPPLNRRVYHSDILVAMLIEAGIKFEEGPDFAGDISPIKKGENYELIGAGIIYKNERGELLLLENSIAYGLTPNQKHLEDLAQHLPEGIKLRILADK
ncbi:MAG: hypothetical protein Q7S06_03380 [Nanoarchaeota archaeon]|nr:hypothetical protein [Nanoarchaeota archaeon]